jgi:hypothetical protein
LPFGDAASKMRGVPEAIARVREMPLPVVAVDMRAEPVGDQAFPGAVRLVYGLAKLAVYPVQLGRLPFQRGGEVVEFLGRRSSGHIPSVLALWNTLNGKGYRASVNRVTRYHAKR